MHLLIYSSSTLVISRTYNNINININKSIEWFLYEGSTGIEWVNIDNVQVLTYLSVAATLRYVKFRCIRCTISTTSNFTMV